MCFCVARVIVIGTRDYLKPEYFTGFGYFDICNLNFMLS